MKSAIHISGQLTVAGTGFSPKAELDAKFSYYRSSAKLDYDLYEAHWEQEDLSCWRPDPESEWIQYPDYTCLGGSMTNEMEGLL